MRAAQLKKRLRHFWTFTTLDVVQFERLAEAVKRAVALFVQGFASELAAVISLEETVKLC